MKDKMGERLIIWSILVYALTVLGRNLSINNLHELIFKLILLLALVASLLILTYISRRSYISVMSATIAIPIILYMFTFLYNVFMPNAISYSQPYAICSGAFVVQFIDGGLSKKQMRIIIISYLVFGFLTSQILN